MADWNTFHMADQTDNPAPPEQRPERPPQRAPELPAESGSPENRSWSQLWQAPVLLAGVLMLGLGIFMVVTDDGDVPDFRGALNSVEEYLQAYQFEDAKQKLTEIELRIPEADEPHRARFELLQGDLVYLQQRAAGLNIESNHELVLRRYERARERNLEFDARHRLRWAETLMSLGRDKAALRFVDQLADQPAEQRYTLIKRLILRQRQRPDGRDPQVLAPLLARFIEELRGETNQRARRAEEIWASALHAESMLDADDPQRALALLQRRFMVFSDQGGDGDLAPLMVLMGRAYLKLGENDEAQRFFQLAQSRLDTADQLNARVLVGLAEIELTFANVQRALEYYTKAENEWPGSPVYLSALVFKADTEAKVAKDPEAIEDFGRAVQLLTRRSMRGDPRRQVLGDLVLSHFEKFYDQQNYERCLDYLTLLKPLHEPNLPPDLLMRFAMAHERLAEQRRAYAVQAEQRRAQADTGAAPPPSRDAIELANREAALHFERAAKYYVQHAHAISGIDDKAYGDSLWHAAANYDSAELWPDAIRVYEELITTRSTDPRQLQAIHALGMAHLADGKPAAAMDLFIRLVNEHPRSPETYASLVPLARAHVRLNQLDDADRTLRYVIDDHPAITPESVPYREALIDIGKLYYRQGQFEAAIERLDEAVKRFGDLRVGGVLRFYLADSYRQAAARIAADLQQPVPDLQLQALQAQRASHLDEAEKLFGQAIEELEQIVEADRSSIEVLYLRNSYFYRGDCAYDLGRYLEAIDLYDQAAKRWENDPASLVALVQIVNAYSELGQVQQARAANRRARAHLKLIPEEAFDDPNLPMTRQHWQDWLRWTNQLSLFDPQSNAIGR